MPTYLLEIYLANLGVDGIGAKVRAAALGMSGDGVQARWRGTIAVPEDEVGFCIVEAPALDIARELATRVHLEVVRVAAAIVS